MTFVTLATYTGIGTEYRLKSDGVDLIVTIFDGIAEDSIRHIDQPTDMIAAQRELAIWMMDLALQEVRSENARRS